MKFVRSFKCTSARWCIKTIGTAVILVAPTTLSACEVLPKRVSFVANLFSPGAQYYQLLSDPSQNPVIKVSKGTEPHAPRGSWTKTSKRLRIIRGERVRVEATRFASGEASSLGFREQDGAFAGSLFLAEGDEHRISEWWFFQADLKGKGVHVQLEYDTPRDVFDALADAVCTYQALPEVVDEVN